MNKATVRNLSEGRLLDLHLAASGSGHVLIYAEGGLRAILLSELRGVLKRPPFKGTLQKVKGVKTTQANLPYGHTQCDEVEEMLKVGRVVLVQYSPENPLSYADVTDEVKEVLEEVSLEEIFGRV